MNSPPIVYLPNMIRDPDLVYAELVKLEWEQRDSARKEYFCSDTPMDYTYGRGKGVRTYSSKPFTRLLESMRGAAEEYAGAKFDVLFLNYYETQRNQLGWHADDSDTMDDARPIVIMSFGVEREIWFRQKMEKETDTAAGDITRMTLGAGSICVMSPGMQDKWQHRIPKASFECGGRISLTFRGYVTILNGA